MSQDEFKQGDKVEWSVPQGKTRGTVKKKLTSNTEVGGQKINASEANPRREREKRQGGRPQARRPEQGLGGRVVADDRQQIIQGFDEAVNMTPESLKGGDPHRGL